MSYTRNISYVDEWIIERERQKARKKREEKVALTKLLLCVVGNGHRSMRPRFPHIRGPFPRRPSVRLHPPPLVDGCIWVPGCQLMDCDRSEVFHLW